MYIEYFDSSCEKTSQSTNLSYNKSDMSVAQGPFDFVFSLVLINLRIKILAMKSLTMAYMVVKALKIYIFPMRI